MFGHAYYGAAYFGPRYFGPVAGAVAPVVVVTPGSALRRRKRLPAMTSAVHQLAEDLQARDRWDAEDADLIDLVLTGVL